MSDDITSIRTALLNAVGNRLAGAQLRALIDSVCPNFDLRAAAGVPVGPGALTKFLKTQFSDLVHLVGKHGGDNLYYIGSSSPNLVPADSSARSPGLWTAFASPAIGHEVVYDQLTKTLSVQPTGGNISTSQVRLASVSRQEFRAIASKFIETSPADAHSDLRKILEQGDFFYQSWVNALRGRDPALYQQWGVFRVREIADIFRARLIAAQIPPGDIDRAAQLLATDQAAAYKERTQIIRASVQPFERASSQRIGPQHSAGSTDLNDLRAIAILAIGSMSLTEIRQLSVPLGAILDSGLLGKK